MNDNVKKRGRGKPPRYAGEEQSRLSIMIRPRYKQALEMLKQHRQCNLTEATELAVINLASQYKIDGIPLIDYVRPENEPFSRYYYGAVDEGYYEADLLDLATDDSEQDHLLKAISPLPPSLTSPLDKYVSEVINKISITDILPLSVFRKKLLFQQIKEDWKEGRSVEETCNFICLASKAIQAKKIYIHSREDAPYLYEDVVPHVAKHVTISEKEKAAIKKYMSGDYDFNNFAPYFEIVEHSVFSTLP